MDIVVEKEKKEMRTAKIFMLVILILFLSIAIISLYVYLTRKIPLSLEIFLSSSVVAIVAWILFSNIKKLERKKEKAKEND